MTFKDQIISVLLRDTTPEVVGYVEENVPSAVWTSYEKLYFNSSMSYTDIAQKIYDFYWKDRDKNTTSLVEDILSRKEDIAILHPELWDKIEQLITEKGYTINKPKSEKQSNNVLTTIHIYSIILIGISILSLIF